MADKTFRPITDVEIVEQMGENDTVLIEQNGMIKRTKGVVGGGGGEKYVIEIALGADGPVASWVTPVSYDSFLSKITSGEDIRVIQRQRVQGLGVVSFAEACIGIIPNESMDAIIGIDFKFAIEGFPPIRFNSDGTLEIKLT